MAQAVRVDFPQAGQKNSRTALISRRDVRSVSRNAREVLEDELQLIPDHSSAAVGEIRIRLEEEFRR